ncbi:MAG: hypothetical protein NXI22_00850, partial [bacterium]|nr:hypothetical protein [bacterium]
MRQHLCRVLGRQLPAIGGSFVLGEVFAFFEADGDQWVWVHKQVILGEKPRKQHAVPMFVADLLDESREFLFAIVLAMVTELPTVNSQPPAEFFFVFAKMAIRLSSTYAQLPAGG